MSNDLLFSIIPRANNQVPVKDRGQIKRIDPMINTEALNEEEREVHSSQRKVSEKEQYREHEQSQGKQSGGQDASSQESSGQSDADVADSYDESGKKSAESDEHLPKRRKHIDKFV